MGRAALLLSSSLASANQRIVLNFSSGGREIKNHSSAFSNSVEHLRKAKEDLRLGVFA